MNTTRLDQPLDSSPCAPAASESTVAPRNPAKDGEIILRYAHAVKDPFNNRIAKPFELRNINATFKAEQDWHALDGEFVVTVTADGQAFTDSHPDRSEAIQLAIHEAEYCLMDASRLAWRNPVHGYPLTAVTLVKGEAK